MKRLLLGLAVLPFIAGISLAAQPVPLSDQQMDTVTAGFDFTELDVQNLGTVRVDINLPPVAFPPGGCSCFLQINGTTFAGSGTQSFQLFAAFGPHL
jgi:hypothetical protein